MMSAVRTVGPRFGCLGGARSIVTAETARGSLCGVEAGRGVFYFRVDGSYSKELYDRGFGTPMTLEILKHDEVELFVDWWDLTGYDSAVRGAATDWAIEHRGRVQRMEVVMRSRLVAMGVNTAAMLLALRGINLHVCSSLDPFERSLEDAIARHQ
jgi:hypothetical protein